MDEICTIYHVLQYFGVNIIIVQVRKVDDDTVGVTSILCTGHERGQVQPGEWASVYLAKHGTCLFFCVQVVVHVAHECAVWQKSSCTLGLRMGLPQYCRLKLYLIPSSTIASSLWPVAIASQSTI